MAIDKATALTTGEVRLSYEHLLRPHASKPGNEEKYSVTLLIPKGDYATKQRIDAAITAAIQEGIACKWGGTRPVQPPVPIYDGDGLRPTGEPFGDECKGHWVMTASSKNRQEIVDMNLNPIINATDIYSGMYARVNINFFAYNSAGKRGIGCGLGPVQKTRDGEPLGGKVSAAEVFGAPSGYTTAVYGAAMPATPTAGYTQAPQQAYGAQPAYEQPRINPINGQPM